MMQTTKQTIPIYKITLSLKSIVNAKPKAYHKYENQTIYRLGQPRSNHDTRGDGLSKAIYGCNHHIAYMACKATGTRRSTYRYNRSKDQISRLEKWRSENYLRGSNRKRKQVEDHQRHRKRGTYRGQNRRRGLPVRGQRTSSNHITARRRNRIRGSLV